MRAYFRFCGLLITIVVLLNDADAQQTIFNVPSGDVMDKGAVYGEFDVTTPASLQSVISPPMKWNFYDGGRSGWTFLVCDNVLIPVQNKTYDAGN